MNIRELIAAMKSDRPQLDMIVEALDLLANQTQSPPAAERSDPVALDVIQLKLDALESTNEALQSKLDAAEAKIESINNALQAAESKIESMKKTLAEVQGTARLLANRLTAFEDKATEFKLAEESAEKGKSKKAQPKRKG